MTLEKEILIADSGATKTDWCLTKNGEIIQRFPTKGISPVFQTGEEIAQEIRSHVYPELKDAGIKAIYFYGSPKRQNWYVRPFTNPSPWIPFMSTATW